MESMTGFGRATRVVGQKQITAEIRSVNHRYLELSLRIPDSLAPVEPQIRQLVSDSVSRGKAELSIKIRRTGKGKPDLVWDPGMASFYLDTAKEMEREYGIPNDLTAFRLLQMPDVVTAAESSEDAEQTYQEIRPVLEEALENLHHSRQAEGERLKKDLSAKADDLLTYVDMIEERAPELVASYKAHLTQKVRETLQNENIELDESRIASEVTIYADKICIDEEIVRLKSHVAELQKDLESSDPVGRKLDFVIQEMNRESNTILSKSTDVVTADLGIKMKTLVEKIREQVQNIE